MSDDKRVRGVYGKPLVKGTELEEDPDRRELLEETGKEAVEAIRKEIRRLSFDSPASDLIDSFDFKVKGKSTLEITSDHEATEYLNRGVQPHQMTYLLKADSPIPIVTDDGKVKFRSATEKSMRDGSWYHPGFSGKHFLERGVEKARNKIKDKVKDSIENSVKKRIKELF